jgi:hypothetical protein
MLAVVFTLVITHMVLARLPSSSGQIAISIIGSLAALLAVRALLDLVAQRAKEECPMLFNCPRYRVVETCEVCIATAVLCVASMTAYGLAVPWADQNGSVVAIAFTLMSLLFITFILCRVMRVTRGVESGMLLAFGTGGIAADCL